MRLDQYLCEQGLAESRQKGHALIMAGHVYVNGARAEKPGTSLQAGAQVEVRGKDHGYVSRGGLKLEKALQVFGASPKGLVCMDVGASSGGFTDCMLQNGAAKVYAVDVGYGQFAWKLRCDARVVVMERTNIRSLTANSLSEKVCFFAVDVAFISLKHVFPVMNALSDDECEAICLVKTQFEAGREKVGKNGVVRDIEVHKEVVLQVSAFAQASGFSSIGLDYSPIKGPKGNVEFLLWVRKEQQPAMLCADLAAEMCAQAHGQLGV